MAKSVLIVGGGVAGLSIAWKLIGAGCDVRVLERGSRAGGVIRSERVDGALVEHGPQGFLGERPGVLDAVEELGLSDTLVPASDIAKKRYLHHDGKLVPLPMSPGGLLRTPLLSVGGKLRLLREPWSAGPPAAPETIRDFAVRRIGAEAADVLVDAAVTGIFAGDPAQLSLESCFPKMVRLERDHGGLFKGMMAKREQGGSPMGTRLHSFRDGMEELITALTRKVGERIEVEARVDRLEAAGSGWIAHLEDGRREEAEAVVVTMPAPRTAALLDGVAPATVAGLREIPYSPVAVVALLWDTARVGHPLDGYGFLAPGGRFPVLGCLFESTVFTGRAPDGKVLLRTLVGGARNPQATERPEEEIVKSAVDALRPLLDLAGDPASVRCVVWPGAIPQYDVRHPERLRTIEKELRRLPGLHLAGAALRGVSVNHLVADATRAAAEVCGEPR